MDFVDLRGWLKGMKDPRFKEMTTYELPVVIWEGLLLFLLKLGSRRQINYELRSEEMVNNVRLLTKEELERLPHDGTLAYLLGRLDPEELSVVRTKMVKSLIRKRCLERYRLRGYYLVAIDGSGCLTFKEKHCERCLKVEKDGKVLYYKHPVLEAKLVTENGLAFSLGTEFKENRDAKVKVQDCELKAFYRLAEKIKKDFPQLNICLLLDGLYANGPVIEICNRNHWKYITTFKEGSMPERYREYESLKKSNPENRGKYEKDGTKQEYYWAMDVLQYDGIPNANVMECIETKKGKEKRFVWLTNFLVSEHSYREIGGGGRLRWKIENEGFNMQKNGGYNLEHPYSKSLRALKNFYLLLQIAHIISQLMEKSSLLAEAVLGSIRNLSRRLLESLRSSSFNPGDLEIIESARFQIRLLPP